VSINGANRLGSNSLPECLVFGARAGRSAALHAADARRPGPAIEKQGNDERRRLDEDVFRRGGGSDRISTIRKQMQAILEEAAGIYRDGDTLTKAADKLHELRERAATAAIDDTSRRFNTERVTGLELTGMLELAECIVHSALRREESRGAHQRTDFPERDDNRFLAHSLVHREPDGSPRVSHLPVTITRWPPGKRVYGR
jgi:fumarate reductase flavoprotein subunit